MIPVSTGSLSQNDIEITVGTVKATDSRVTGGTIQRGETHANLNIMPVVWLEDGNGVEHSFEGGPFAEARAGQEMIVARRRSNGKILRVYNLATRTSTDKNDLVPLTSGPGNLLSGTILLSIVGIIPFVLLYTAGALFLLETFLGRAARNTFDLGAHFPYVAILLGLSCFWLTHRWISNSHAKAKALSNLVDEAVRARGLPVQKLTKRNQ